MLGNIIFVVLLIILIRALSNDVKDGIIYYIIFSLVSPNLNIGNIQISFEIIAFLIIFLLLLIVKRNIFSFSVSKFNHRQNLLVYFIIYCIASLIAAFKYGSEIPWVSIFSVFRSIFILYMINYTMEGNEDEAIDRIISPVLYICLITSLIQMAVPGSVTLFYNFYYKSSLTPLASVLELGHFDRAFGSFGTPVYLGVFSLYSFSLYYGFIVENKKIRNIFIKLASSVIIGLFALSKTAILGIPIILMVYFLVFVPIENKVNKKLLRILLIIFIIIIITVIILKFKGTAISWYLDYLKKPLAAFKTRYNMTTGILSETYKTIKDNLIIGVGATALDNNFTGDSMYVNIIYNTGLIGAAIFFINFIWAGINNFRFKNITAFFCFTSICLAGLAAPVQFDIITAAFMAYIFYKSGSKKQRQTTTI